MKIIDAIWEKRNLGVTTNEVIFESKDSIESFLDNKDFIENKEYIVLKVPFNKNEITSCIQDQGYKYIESMITVRCNYCDFKLPEKYNKLASRVYSCKMNENDLDKLYKEIDRGLFKTDRIYLDDYFSHKLAAQRYNFWIKDNVEKGISPYCVFYNDKQIGFFLDEKKEDNIYYGILGGVYNGFESLGLLIMMEEFVNRKNVGAKAFISHVSSNNLSIIKIYETFGFQMTELYYVFIKHK